MHTEERMSETSAELAKYTHEQPSFDQGYLGTFPRNFRIYCRWTSVLARDFYFALYIIDLTRDRGYEVLRCYVGNDMH